MTKIKSYLFSVFFITIFTQNIPATEIDDLQGKIQGLHSNFTANFSYSSSEGNLVSGKIYYQYPNKLNVQFNDGKVIATNGKYLWVYDPATKICARQVVKEDNVGGIFYFLRGGYSVQESNGRYTFSRPDAIMSEITLKVEENILKSVQFKIKDEVMNMSFSNVVPNTSIKASLFNYKPDPEAQMVENPLNRIGNITIQNQSKDQKVQQEQQD